MVKKISGKHMIAVLLVTVLCLCSRFYGDVNGKELLIFQVIFTCSRQELLALGESATSIMVAMSFRDSIWFVVLFSMLAFFPWIHEFADSWTGGNYYLLISRKSRMRYALDYIVRGAVSGFCIVVIGILIYIGIIYLKFPMYQARNGEGMFVLLYGESRLQRALTLGRAVLHTGLLASVWSVFSMILIVITNNRFFAMSAPMLINYISDKLLNAYHLYISRKYENAEYPMKYHALEYLFPSRHLYYDTTFSQTFGMGYGVYLGLFLLTFLLLAGIFCGLVKRRNG